MDPTVRHPSSLAPNVFFAQMGAPMLGPVAANWLIASPVLMAKTLGFHNISVIKMDCEGCEYALAQDVLAHDARFFERVNLISLEIHTGKLWCKTRNHVVGLGKLWLLLKQAGLHLIDADITLCAPEDEAHGCLQDLVDAGYPCIPKKMCQNFLWARKML
jgi:hypothetical protein